METLLEIEKDNGLRDFFSEIAKVDKGSDFGKKEIDINYQVDYTRETQTFSLLGDFQIDKILDLEKDFKLWNKKDIQEFIELHLEINEYIRKAVYFIKKYFKPTQKIELRLVGDDESINNKNKILFLYIPVNLHPKKAIELLYKIDRILFDDQGLNEDIFDINIKFR